MKLSEGKPVVSLARRIQLITGLLAFIVALLLSIVGGIVSPDRGQIVLALVILGIIVGLLNVSQREMAPLLLAAIALVVVGGAGFAALDSIVASLGTTIDHMVHYMAVFMAPAALISAIRIMVAVGVPS
ncbi:MAG: hypothetical protein Q7T04_03775 [Dehalococcoidia bacterium]|nr:hypothetical protein [Dehalococcoidia bacterium]